MHGRVPPVRMAANDFPTALRNLSLPQQLALAVIVLHQGNPRRHRGGYLRKDQLSALSWNVTSVQQRVRALPVEAQQPTLVAFQWLLCAGDSVYMVWVRAHEAAMQHGELALPPTALLEPFLETAVFPSLYPLKHMCESSGLVDREWAPFEIGRTRSRNSGMRSAKADFIRKVLSDVVDFADSYRLLQFQFDRYILRCSLLSGLVADKAGCSIDNSMAHRHWTGGYWRKQHAVLQDVVLQLGHPHLFLTVSPWEKDFPFPYFVEKARRLCSAMPTQLAALETLSIAHVLHQVVCGYMAGRTGGTTWKSHLLVDGCAGHGGVQAFFARYEFQDGGLSHECGKGRGGLHVHVLFWLSNPHGTHLDLVLRAEVPQEDPELEALVLRVQRSDQRSRAPVQQEPSHWHWSSKFGRWECRLRQPQSFVDKKLRPYVISLLRVLRCSQDVQWWSGAEALLRYVAGYVSKFDEAWQQEWLRQDVGALQCALTIARNWKPAAPEQVMTLAREAMAMSNVTAVVFYPPDLLEADSQKHVMLYRRRSIDIESQTLLQWLRKHLVSGTAGDRTLHACPRRDNSVVGVAVMYAKLLSEKFFRQWVLLHVPHRTDARLCPGPAMRAGAQYRSFACALLAAPDTWENPVWLRTYLEKLGHRVDFVSSAIQRVLSMTQLVRGQIAGTVPRSMHVVVVSDLNGELSQQQGKFVLMYEAQRTLREEAEDAAQCMREVSKAAWRPLVLVGGPGTGKSFCVSHIVARAASAGLGVVVATPTGMLAARTSVPANVVCTTIHRAFAISADNHWGFADWVLQQDVWVVGEAGMVDASLFRHIMAHWFAADKWPVLIFEGDFQQLAPMGPDGDMRGDRLFRLCRTFDLGLSSMRSADPKLTQFLREIRSGPPTATSLSEFLKRTFIGADVSWQTLSRGWAALPGATVVTAYRTTADLVNACGLRACKGAWLGEITAWCEKEHVRKLWLKEGVQVQVTRNYDVALGLVNGVLAAVVALTPAGIILRLGNLSIVTLARRGSWTKRDGRDRLEHHYDVDLGYAQTCHKAEGATLSPVIVCLEGWRLPGWCYTALSRAVSLDTLGIIGDPHPDDFVPRL